MEREGIVYSDVTGVEYCLGKGGPQSSPPLIAGILTRLPAKTKTLHHQCTKVWLIKLFKLHILALTQTADNPVPSILVLKNYSLYM